MNTFLAHGVILSLVALAGQAGAQPDPRKSLDALQARGQQEMAPNWRPLGMTHKAAIFLHNDVRKAEQGRLAVWTHNELPVAEYIDKEKAYLSTRERLLVDCKSSRIGMSDQAFYAEHFARGAVAGINRNSQVDMQETVPDSVEELLVKTVCAPKPRKPAAKAKTAAKSESKPENKSDNKSDSGSNSKSGNKAEKK
ncbi:MAG TPA: surface-adhesin E family protein [Noviherbaspirillum sp.]